MKQIEWINRARRQVVKISDRRTREAIVAAVETLTNWPEVKGVKALEGRKGYRLRAGRYRIFFTVEPVIIVIAEVKIRNERTY